ncbi:PID-CTERM protein-sorting domain-containing protein [Psychroserpens mesophilus]|uniref:PID-CTERM protein-sorting domain-containing protein n=1 Tax=Psychroserpens mesophilus TaxID=325473 RepID=UPI003D654956
MKIQNRKNIASILFVLISFVCSAQPDTAPPPPVPPPPPGMPIDDFLPVLLVIALVYGIVKRFKYSRR